MAGERAAAGALALTSFWDLGSAWKSGMDANLLKTSVLGMPVAASRVTSLPGSPSQGQVFIVPSGDANGNQIAAYDGGAWTYYIPAPGWFAFVTDEAAFVRYSGSAWEVYVPPTRLNVQGGTTYTLTNTDLNGRTIIIFTSASPVAFTVPVGLTGVEPVGCIVDGAGAVTISPSGTTVHSKNGLVGAAGSVWSLLRRSTDTFRAVGELTTP